MVKIFLVIMTSLYFFPLTFKALPNTNTKMLMAGIGLVIYIIQLAKGRSGTINKDMFFLSMCAAFVSLMGIASMAYNSTPDDAYARYLLSMWVWVGGAYFLCFLIKSVHGHNSVLLVCNYLISVCIIQCALALLFDMNHSIRDMIDIYIEQGQDFLNAPKVKRLYGIGASLDVAGTRFAAVLIMIVFIMLNYNMDRKYFGLYIFSFIFITIVGNMIARTTSVGVIIALLYALYISKFHTFHLSSVGCRLWVWMSCAILITIPFVVVAYNTVPEFYRNLRFGFEAFFNFIEEGEWYTASTDTLKSMYEFPNALKTWIIGDGYFANPINVDPYYTGKITGGFYKSTDVGYLRFIYYFGLIGLVAMCTVMYKACFICVRKLRKNTFLFVMLLILNYVIWLKVSTDIFLVFALFLMVDRKEDDAFMERIVLKEQ